MHPFGECNRTFEYTTWFKQSYLHNAFSQNSIKIALPWLLYDYYEIRMEQMSFATRATFCCSLCLNFPSSLALTHTHAITVDSIVRCLWMIKTTDGKSNDSVYACECLSKIFRMHAQNQKPFQHNSVTVFSSPKIKGNSPSTNHRYAVFTFHTQQKNRWALRVARMTHESNDKRQTT